MSTGAERSIQKREASTGVLERRLERENRRVELLEQAIEEKQLQLSSEQQRLKALNSYLNNVLETMLSALIVSDDQFRVERVNQMAQRLLGWDVFEILGMPLAEFLPLEQVAPAAQLAEAGVLQVETVVVNRDGLKIPVLASSSLIWNEQTGSSTLVCVLVDLRSRKKLEAQLLQTQKLESVGQLAAGIAHEINTPIQFIGDNLAFVQSGLSELLTLIERLGAAVAEPTYRSLCAACDLPYLREEMPKAIAQSLSGVERVTKIVRAMKDFSHPGRDAKQSIDIHKLLESTLTICTNEWKYAADARIVCEAGLPLVPALPGELSQAFLNLIINAVHAIQDRNALTNRSRGLITISAQKIGEQLEVRITDDGMGVPEDIRARIFEPFFTTKEVGRGTGQGLSLTRSIIVDRHGGTLEFESEVGVGTSFIIRLPLQVEAEYAQPVVVR